MVVGESLLEGADLLYNSNYNLTTVFKGWHLDRQLQDEKILFVLKCNSLKYLPIISQKW
jgi:hypothetical protein